MMNADGEKEERFFEPLLNAEYDGTKGMPPFLQDEKMRIHLFLSEKASASAFPKKVVRKMVAISQR